MPDSKQSLHQKGGFYQVGTIVFGAKWNGGAIDAIEPVGKGSVVPLHVVLEEVYDLLPTCYSFATGNKPSFNSYNYGHNPKTRTTRGDQVARGVSLPGESADGMTKIPEIAEGLFLNQVEESFV